jgi:hypothetical protein
MMRHLYGVAFWLVDIGSIAARLFAAISIRLASSFWFSMLEISGPGHPDISSFDWRLKWLI